MKTRRLFMFIAIALLGGCAFGRSELLPASRNVKTVAFPVRHLSFSDIKSRQEYELVTVSGTVTNMSPYTLTNVGATVILFFAEATPAAEISSFSSSDEPSSYDPTELTRKISVSTTPPTIFPHDSATFEMTTKVKDPVARVEVHGVWTKAD